MLLPRPYCLSIAGFDPSGGAGVLADIKTFEAHKVVGMSVVTGLTFQNDSEFDSVKWIETDEILKQIHVLSRKFKFEFVKIGMIKNLENLEKIIADCRLQTADCKIIWDPIIRSSAGFEIQKNLSKEKIIELCKRIYLITPNTDEIRILMNDSDEMKAANELSQYCNVFLKGGHSESKKGRDFLFTSPLSNGEGSGVRSFRPKQISAFPKHGSGCVLSSAIAANLAKGETLHRSCLKAKNYVTEFLMSNKTLLGNHKL